MKAIILSLLVFGAMACQNSSATVAGDVQEIQQKKSGKPIKTNAVGYFASGCFWCVEAVFESVKGVGEVESGYAGGTEKNPTYEMVGSGRTHHAESVKVYYDSTIVSYSTLVKVFFGSHDPTTLNQQGPDRGPQYRSIIFYQNDSEKQLADAYIMELLKNKIFTRITTEVVPFEKFYIAEGYHQNYEKLHPDQSYVRAVSIPRLNAFKAKYPELLK
ncbi:MAG: peptide-methionine (S)-S-oxide reductase MsrA [Crocinitomicaceae bacterium]